MILALYAIPWTEYERGWGCRPDGISFHRTEEEAKAFREKVVGDRSGPVPDEYTSPGKMQLVQVSKSLYDKVTFDGNYWSTLNQMDRAAHFVAPQPTSTQWTLPL